MKIVSRSSVAFVLSAVVLAWNEGKPTDMIVAGISSDVAPREWPAQASEVDIAVARGHMALQLSQLSSPASIQTLTHLASSPQFASAGGPIHVTFDQTPAGSEFLATSALSGFVEGAFISGRFPNGGAILDEDSSFGVTGHSSPNFLAFNAEAALQGGGLPILPELFRLGSGLTHIEFLAGAGTIGQPFGVAAFGPGGLGPLVFHTTQNVMQLIQLDGSNLAGFIVLGAPRTLVIDEIRAY